MSLPKLPSVQSMLEGVKISDNSDIVVRHNQSSFGHKRHASEHQSSSNIIDTAFKRLSIEPLEPKINDHNTHNNATTNNTNIGNTIMTSVTPLSSTLCSPFPPPRVAHLQSHHRSPRNLHSRSFSDYTHPYVTSTTTSSSSLVPIQHTFHRRAVSTNTLDFILQPIMQRPLDQYNAPPSLCASSSTSTVTTNAPYSPVLAPVEDTNYYSSDDSLNAPCVGESARHYHSLSPDLSNNQKIDSAHLEQQHQQMLEQQQHGAGQKYSCPYCMKGFSRPSSLLIHTYSHTGERPFECPETGCSRKFSVQSNMRRHLKVHRLGRPLKRNGGLISPADRAQLINKPLAAKPISRIGQNSVTRDH